MAEVQNTTQYLPELSHIIPESVDLVKVNPNNGTTFSPGSFVEFRLNPNSGAVLDNSKCKLSCKFLAKPVAGIGDEAYNLFSSPSLQSAIERITITVGQNVIEDITNYNRCYSALSRVYTSDFQTESGGSLFDLYSGAGSQNERTASTGKLLNTASASPPVANAFELSIPLSLSSFFGPSSKFAFPIHAIKEPCFVRIFLSPSVNELLYSKKADGSIYAFGAGTSYTLSEVSLDVCQINYDFENMRKIKSLMEEETVYCVKQIQSTTANIDYSAQARVILPNMSYSCVNNIIFHYYYNSFSAGSDITIGASPGCGVFRNNLFINGVSLNSIQTGTNNSQNPYNSNSSFGASLIKLNRDMNMLFDTSTQLSIPVGALASTTIKPNYNNVNGVVGLGIPSVATNGINASTPIASPEPTGGFISGFDLKQALDGGDLKGMNLMGKQVVYSADQNNTIVDSVLRTVQAVANVSVKVYLNVKDGTMRVQY